MSSTNVNVTENPHILNVMDIVGYPLLGAVLSCALWGISCMQLFLYFINSERDPVSLKIYVVIVWLVATANDTLGIIGLFPPLIIKWGSLAAVSTTQNALKHKGWVSGIVQFAVQMFFMRRIYKLSKISWLKYSIPIIVIPMSLGQIVGGIFYARLLYLDLSTEVLFTPEVIGIEIGLRISSAFVDILIAISMVYLLYKGIQSDVPRLNKLLYRLIIASINTGFWTAFIAVTDLTLVATLRHSQQFTMMEFPLGALYLNTLLGNLNARHYMRNVAYTSSTAIIEEILPVPSAIIFRPDVQSGSDGTMSSGQASSAELKV